MSPTRILRIALLGLVPGIALAASAADDDRFADWIELRTPGFTVTGNAPAPLLRSLTLELARFDSLVARITNAPPGRPRQPVRLYVIRSAKEARALTGGYAGVLFPSLGGYFAVLSAEHNRDETQLTLFHEYTHYVLLKGRRVDYPRWYSEGLSEYLGATSFRDDAVIVGSVLRGRLRDLGREDLIPMEDLFEGGDAIRGSLGRYYATSWALVHHLNSSAAGRKSLRRFVSRLVRGEPWRTAYAAIFDIDPETLTRMIERHVDQLLRGKRFDFMIEASKLSVALETEEQPVPPAEVAYELGVIARFWWEYTDDSDFVARARGLFERAIELDPSHARARAALASSLAHAGDRRRARRLVDDVLAADPEDPRVLFEAATARSKLAEDDTREASEATALFERAVGLDPDHPELQAGLARAYSASGAEPKRAIEAFRRAQELGVFSPDLEIDLAREYLRAGEPTRAEALLVPVAADPHGGDRAEEARRMLDEIRSLDGPDS